MSLGPLRVPPSFFLSISDARGKVELKDSYPASRRDVVIPLAPLPNPTISAASSLPPRLRRPHPSPVTEPSNIAQPLNVSYSVQYIDTNVSPHDPSARRSLTPTPYTKYGSLFESSGCTDLVEDLLDDSEDGAPPLQASLRN
ncbi:hypothetical protein CC1G_06078 [Coprinopsis cinerea okayama7|uniref:Uncharacterized protein n=1 Tax=Coprinopsis cinerea (strain Okayama-7 / 130 / ATCC MYA-4618 / FGSC 9003) TaxID=240176 RepID=A8PA27_COPC7|nr:hypothetical protein CC1G_06078 [Coprinopsis cinerea okayama7\|eukprot:XP_001839888.1 hypothetical protein CC1G_06078 [Coprinopsis cinerea okayama7\